MRSRSAGVASIGTRSLSWRFTPMAPDSANSFTASTGESVGRTASPKGSRPRLPTVQRPKVNLCSGLGENGSVVMARVLYFQNPPAQVNPNLAAPAELIDLNNEGVDAILLDRDGRHENLFTGGNHRPIAI